LSRFTNSNTDGSFNVDGFIDSTVTLYHKDSGKLVEVPYYKSTAYNDDEFESTDSLLIDLILPKTGDYWLKVESFTRPALSTDPDPNSLDAISKEMYLDKIDDTDIGNYELFVYRFKRANESDTMNTIQGRGGFDVIQGTTGEDYNIYLAANAIPTNATSTEVTPLVVTIPFIDPAAGNCTAVVNYGDGSVETIENFTAATGLRISHTFPDAGSYTVNFVLSNDDGKSVSGSFTVTVTNAAPTATWLSTGNLEGGNTTLTVTGIDSVGDTPSLQYVITPTESVRNAAQYSNDAGTSQFLNTYTELFNDNTSKTLYIRVMDRDGLVKDYTTTLVIANVVPTGTISNNGPVNEGSSATISITGASDVSSTDTTAGLRYAFGTSPASLPTTFAAALTSNSANIDFGDNGTYTVYGRVFDKDNGYTEYSTTVVVNNVAPTVSVGSITNPAIQNSPVTITANGFDPAGDNDLLTYAFTVVRVSDGSTVSSAEGASATHTWTPDTTGTYRVTIVATDDDGGVSSTAVQEFEVLSPLTLVVGLPSDGFKGVPGQTRTYSLTANSPGSSGTFTYVIDWKDGTAVQTVNGPASTKVDHIYPLAGTYAPTISVTNSLGRTVSQTLSDIAINAWEVQGSALAIGASDGGSDNDNLTLDALATAGQFAFAVNSASAVTVTATGSIRVFGGLGTDRLIVRGNSGHETLRLSSSSWVYNTNTEITWDSFESQELQAGAGNDTIEVVNGALATIDAGAGVDTIRAVGGTSANTWTITSANAGRMIVGTESTPRFTFANAESVAGSDLVSDSFVFNAGTSLGGSVSGGAGASIVDVLNTSALTGSVNLATGAATGLSGTFSGIESFVSNGGTITGPNVATSWALTGNRIGTVGYTTNSVAFSHSFSGFAVLQGGSGNDTFNVGDGGTRTTVQGGTGTDSLIGQNLQTTWEITEIGGGSFGTLMQFKQIENLTGGNNIDRFRIRSNASIPAVLDGGLGDNILDYSLFTTAVAVDLQSATPSSTNVSSLTNTFPIIMGGSGNDTLKGSRTRSSVIVGGAGIDSILGGDLGDILVGGLGADSLRGGLGEDILVGGRITFDTDVIGLRSIFLEWTRSDRTVDQRFVNLTNNTSGGGTLTSPINGNFFLRGGEDPNARTLLDDSVVDELFGGVESDWFVISASELANLAKHDRTALDKRRTPVAAGW
jgi:hypothetical protein